MPGRTSIEWADYSSNPLRARHAGRLGWACAHVSEGCRACYSETINGRFGTRLPYSAASVSKVEHVLDERELTRILSFRPRGPFKGDTSRPKVFPFDMTDVFGPWVTDEQLDRIFAVFALRPDVDFLLLTKRPERMRAYLSRHDVGLRWAGHVWGRGRFCGPTPEGAVEWTRSGLPNVHLGVSVEDQPTADERIPLLLQTPAAVRFVSAEPLLAPVNFDALWHQWPCTRFYSTAREKNLGACTCDGGISWVIVGGESGPRARPCDVVWIRSIVEQCREANVAVFVKQMGARPMGLRDLCDRCNWQVAGGAHGLDCDRSPVVRDRKGGDISEFPEDLRVREFPRC